MTAHTLFFLHSATFDQPNVMGSSRPMAMNTYIGFNVSSSTQLTPCIYTNRTNKVDEHRRGRRLMRLEAYSN
jgi:hypothetical protein